MRAIHFIIVFLLIGFLNPVYSQTNSTQSLQEEVYRDRITDENGKPLSGIRVEVHGKGIHTYSNFNGNFEIKARIGDVIVLSKNGKRINSYVLDGRTNYRTEDTFGIFDESRISKSKKNSKKYLDSAAFYINKDPNKSIAFIERQLKSEQKHSSKDMARSYSLLGNGYMQLKQYDLAVSSYQTALKNSTDITIQIKLAQALAKTKQYEASNTQFLAIPTKKMSNWQRVTVNEGLGNNAKKQEKRDLALSFYQTALQIARENKITPKISSLNAKIAEVLAEKGERSESDRYLQNTLQSTQTEPIQKRAKVQSKVADVYRANKDFDNEIEIRKQTIEDLEEAQVEEILMEPADDVEDKSTVVSTSQLNLDIGRAYIDKKEYDKAISYLKKSVRKADESKNLDVQKDALQKLSELYKKTGNSKKALQNYEKYARLVDELYRQKEKEIEAAVALTSELRDKQNRINSLEKDRELSEARYRLSQADQDLAMANYRRQRMWNYALGIGLLLLTLVLFSMYRSNKQKRLANNLLALKSLRSQMNPHFIFNALNSVNNFIAQNDERSANRYLTDFSTLMRNVLHNSEKDFIPLSKEIELLKLYLQLEHSRFEDKFDYSIHIDDYIEVDEFQIPSMLLQPYVENAVWHGLRYKKTKGKLTIDIVQKDEENIDIRIVDNGIGRKKSKELKTQNQKKQESKGMNNVKRRIEILNEMYHNKVNVFIKDLYDDGTGTEVLLTLKRY